MRGQKSPKNCQNLKHFTAVMNCAYPAPRTTAERAVYIISPYANNFFLGKASVNLTKGRGVRLCQFNKRGAGRGPPPSPVIMHVYNDCMFILLYYALIREINLLTLFLMSGLQPASSKTRQVSLWPF